ncbi:hypothetical protein CVM73_08700 [Bradyrhizobium forestalis]|uniref:Uncharacterized protein n=2 Tax=Bradyrhizobium forestalis TaxID=1419263 RepID=A0A2M8RCT1_9BRAD|nr:hypothetical protein CVM73_08700 [Bradyrhizobium forestalis]
MVLPSFRGLLPARDIAARIISDDRLKAQALAEILALIEPAAAAALSPPELFRASALARVRLAEVAMARKSSDEADAEIAAAEQKLVEALSVNPTDSFLWLMLYSVETSRSGFDPKTVAHLERSYLAGPNEGWIAVRRNRVALGVFPLLSELAQARVVDEFAEMVDADFWNDTEANLTGIGWAHRDRLLAGLQRVDLVSREAFARMLFRDGYDIQVPGVKQKERPW